MKASVKKALKYASTSLTMAVIDDTVVTGYAFAPAAKLFGGDVMTTATLRAVLGMEYKTPEDIAEEAARIRPGLASILKQVERAACDPVYAWTYTGLMVEGPKGLMRLYHREGVYAAVTDALLAFCDIYGNTPPVLYGEGPEKAMTNGEGSIVMPTRLVNDTARQFLVTAAEPVAA